MSIKKKELHTDSTIEYKFILVLVNTLFQKKELEELVYHMVEKIEKLVFKN